MTTQRPGTSQQSDVTGSVVISSKPVAVISGNLYSEMSVAFGTNTEKLVSQVLLVK